ncbi:unnamed protein product [Penicillium bialowiezense]
MVCPTWRSLVQQRLYHHIKIKGSAAELSACAEWFQRHPHLMEHVRHIEIWVPVWGKLSVHRRLGMMPRELIREWTNDGRVLGEVNGYQLPDDNASLDEIFRFVKTHFASVRIFTLEGGDSYRSHRVKKFAGSPRVRGVQDQIERRLPVLDGVQTFVMRGAWNLIRNWRDWRDIRRALPNITEWQCSYSQVQVEGYVTMMDIMSCQFESIRHINVSLEGFANNHDDVHGPTVKPILQPICNKLAKVALKLETISFTGRVCCDMFSELGRQARSRKKVSPLRSLDLMLKGCCRNQRGTERWLPVTHQLAGVNQKSFNRAFHQLVLSAVRALDVLPSLTYLRIRFIDFDWEFPFQNPYFELQNDKCTGLWSPAIVSALRASRPSASFVQLSNGIEPEIVDGELVGVQALAARPVSILASQYVIIAENRLP